MTGFVQMGHMIICLLKFDVVNHHLIITMGGGKISFFPIS